MDRCHLHHLSARPWGTAPATWRTVPIVALDTEVREMTGHVGSFVANMHETLDKIGRILRDEPEP